MAVGLTYENICEVQALVMKQIKAQAPAWAQHLESRGISVDIDAWRWRG